MDIRVTCNIQEPLPITRLYCLEIFPKARATCKRDSAIVSIYFFRRPVDESFGDERFQSNLVHSCERADQRFQTVALIEKYHQDIRTHWYNPTAQNTSAQWMAGKNWISKSGVKFKTHAISFKFKTLLSNQASWHHRHHSKLNADTCDCIQTEAPRLWWEVMTGEDWDWLPSSSLVSTECLLMPWVFFVGRKEGGWWSLMAEGKEGCEVKADVKCQLSWKLTYLDLM